MDRRFPIRQFNRLALPAASILALLMMLISCGEPMDPGLEGAPTPSVLTGFSSGEASRSPGVRLQGQDGIPRNTLEWTRCPDADFFSYVLCRSMPEPGNSPGDDLYGIMMTTDQDCTSFDDLEVIWGEEYIYSLMTVNTLEMCSWSNQVQLLVPGSAPSPSYLEVSGILADRVSLGWTVCPDPDFQKYVLYRSASPDIMLDPDEADVMKVFYFQGANSWEDVVTCGETFYYCIKTVNDKEFSSWSNEVDAFAPEPPFPWFQLGWIYTSSPMEGCALPDGSLLYVTNQQSDCVSVYEMNDYIRVAQVAVGDQPQGISCSPDGEYMYVCCYMSGTLVTIDTGDNTVVGEVPVPVYCSSVLSPPPGNRLYILRPAVRQLFAMDVSTGLITDTLLLEGTPGDIVASQDGERLYLTDRSRSKLIFVETEGFTVEREVSTAGLSEGLVISDEGLLFCSMSNGRLFVINGISGEVVHLFSPGYHGFGLGVLPGTDYIYIADTGENVVCTVDGSTGGLLGVRTEDSPSDIVCMPDGERIGILSHDFNDVTILGFL